MGTRSLTVLRRGDEAMPRSCRLIVSSLNGHVCLKRALNLEYSVTINRTPFTVEDLYDLSRLGAVQISPDGGRVAFVKVTVDHMANGSHRAIYRGARWPGFATTARRPRHE